MKNTKRVGVLVLVCIFVALISVIGRANPGLSHCKDSFPSQPGCWNGSCNEPQSAGACELRTCYCSTNGKRFNHDCSSGEDEPECPLQ